MFLTDDEKLVLTWLQNYGPLPRAQLEKLVKKNSSSAYEGIMRHLRNQRLTANVSGGYYIGLDKNDKVNQKVIQAMWVFLYFAKDVDPHNHRVGDYPCQIFFLKGKAQYQIMVVSEGLEYEVSMIGNSDRETKYIFVLQNPDSKAKVERYLPSVPCVFASVISNGIDSEPIIQFSLPTSSCDCVSSSADDDNYDEEVNYDE